MKKFITICLALSWFVAASPVLMAQSRKTILMPPPAPGSNVIKVELPAGSNSNIKLMPPPVPDAQVAAIGVALKPILDHVAVELGIHPGFGLRIHGVAPKSAVSGVLKSGDVIYKFNDQFVVNIHQLHALLSTYKPGDKVSISAFVNGKLNKYDIKLIGRPYTPIFREPYRLELPEIKLNPFNLGDMKGMHERIMKMQQRVAKSAAANGPGATVTTKSFSSMSIIELDNDYKYRLSGTAGNFNFNVKQMDGRKVLFDGAVNTAEEKAKVPAKFKEKLAKMLQSSAGYGQSTSNINISVGNDLIKMDFGKAMQQQQEAIKKLHQTVEEINRRVHQMHLKKNK